MYGAFPAKHAPDLIRGVQRFAAENAIKPGSPDLSAPRASYKRKALPSPRAFSAFRKGLVNHHRQRVIKHQHRNCPRNACLTSLVKPIPKPVWQSRVHNGRTKARGGLKFEASHGDRRDPTCRIGSRIAA
jgi:hypothetical protein